MSLGTDQENKGKRSIEEFSVAGALSTNTTDNNTRRVKFLVLKNCLVDKRIGGLVRRAGSLTETIANGLGVPNGIGEYTTPASSNSIPLNRVMLAAFSGSFYSQLNNSWSQVTVSPRCSFNTGHQAQFAKIGSNMFIANGLPAKWSGPGTQIDRMGIIAPVNPVTAVPTGTGITLSTGTRYMFTYKDSTTGLESDWSPLSVDTGPVSNKSILVTFPTLISGNYDKLVLYRTLDGGGTFPYNVAELPIDTTTYTDSIPDAQLTYRAVDRYTNLPPPSESYLIATFAQSVWMVDAKNPYLLKFSKPYIGQDVDLEYWPQDNYLVTNKPITALFVVPGKLLVFHPRDISFISGSSGDDFVINSFLPGKGTLFPQSISTNGKNMVFLSEEGLVSLDGTNDVHISREIDLDLQPILSGSYNSSLYLSSTWSTALRQFLFSISAFSTVDPKWEEDLTGKTTDPPSGWEDSVSLGTETWEELGNLNPVAISKIKIWGWSPELSSGSNKDNVWHEYSFNQFLDGNSSNQYPVYLFHSSPSTDTGDPQQDKTYIGYWDGTQGKILAAFKKTLNNDDGVSFSAEWLTDRIIPGEQNGGWKMFQSLNFTESYSDPTSDSFTTLKYVKDFADPHLRNYQPQLVTITDTATDAKRFPQALARFIHLYGIDNSQSQTKILLSNFFVHFRERFLRNGR